MNCQRGRVLVCSSDDSSGGSGWYDTVTLHIYTLKSSFKLAIFVLLRPPNYKRPAAENAGKAKLTAGSSPNMRKCRYDTGKQREVLYWKARRILIITVHYIIISIFSSTHWLKKTHNLVFRFAQGSSHHLTSCSLMLWKAASEVFSDDRSCSYFVWYHGRASQCASWMVLPCWASARFQ